MDYYRPVYRDFCLPAGNLRESARNASRAHVLVVNKCPQNLSEEERQHIIKKLNPRKDQKIFFSTISYLPPRKLGNPAVNQPMEGKIKDAGDSILGLAGIGNPAPFFEELKKSGLPLTPLTYRDHHEFSMADLQGIEQTLHKLGPEALLLTTEKDAVRLAEMKLPPLIMEKSWYLPIQLQILFDEQEAFNKIITDYVRAT
jgi:tetraacyldisaccharide 4'-kinase